MDVYMSLDLATWLGGKSFKELRIAKREKKNEARRPLGLRPQDQPEI
jgi:hypothetical protein